MWKYISKNYIINEYGIIKNCKTDHILSPYINNHGYKMIDLRIDHQKQKCLVHRLVALCFVPNPYNYPIVLHIDNNKLNCYYQNLKWGTYSENNSQAISDGLNRVPKPENTKWYVIYNNSNEIICNGIKEIIDELGFGNDSMIRNYIHRNSYIPYGKYAGYQIKRKDLSRHLTMNEVYKIFTNNFE